jgi:hypothetical protein
MFMLHMRMQHEYGASCSIELPELALGDLVQRIDSGWMHERFAARVP